VLLAGESSRAMLASAKVSCYVWVQVLPRPILLPRSIGGGIDDTFKACFYSVVFSNTFFSIFAYSASVTDIV